MSAPVVIKTRPEPKRRESRVMCDSDTSIARSRRPPSFRVNRAFVRLRLDLAGRSFLQAERASPVWESSAYLPISAARRDMNGRLAAVWIRRPRTVAPPSGGRI